MLTNKLLTRKNDPPPGGHIGLYLGAKFFNQPEPFWNSSQHIIGTNLQTNHLTKNTMPLWQPYIIGKNLLTNFYEDWTINVASGVNKAIVEDGQRTKGDYKSSPLRGLCSGITPPPSGCHIFQLTRTIFNLIQDIIKTNVLTKKSAPPPYGPYIIWKHRLTKFHIDWTINVASRVLKPCFSNDWNHFQTHPSYHTPVLTKKNASHALAAMIFN
ncbi:hypothetical protein DPMN_107735 [Dreissena polymorpha]|uniref:Uncharacterized protein n=1 Tax=Dreissena polymorpha TaxID=45954 RepID=A0A9D4K7F3_DREPO|nr:hypothetical protein DPMN_107735 [Dreissena polymorpha]